MIYPVLVNLQGCIDFSIYWSFGRRDVVPFLIDGHRYLMVILTLHIGCHGVPIHHEVGGEDHVSEVVGRDEGWHHWLHGHINHVVVVHHVTVGVLVVAHAANLRLRLIGLLRVTHGHLVLMIVLLARLVEKLLLLSDLLLVIKAAVVFVVLTTSILSLADFLRPESFHALA